MKKKMKKSKVDKLLVKALKSTRKKIVEASPEKLKQIADWANQEVVIKCKMYEAGDLMDLLFMADGGPFEGYFRDTIKLNKMEKSYEYWLNKMVDIVCKEDLKKDGKSRGIQQNKK